MKKLSKSSLLLLLFLWLGITACNNAAETEREYGDIDLNADASLDDDEFGTVWSESGYYGRWDANNNDFLDENEWNTGKENHLPDFEGSFSDWDEDGDDRLSEEEFKKGIYGYYDKDQDRMINEEEYNAWYRENR